MTTSTQVLGQRYQTCFATLADKKEGAFIPFVTLGDPSYEQSVKIVKTLIDAGADALELGIPFSDPSADGVTIQEAGKRSLAARTSMDDCLAMLAEIRDYAPQIPIGLLLYGNLVFARGIDTFYQDVAKAGVDSVLIADLPIRESERFRSAASAAGVAPIFIAPPNANEEKLAQVAQLSQGYTYVLSRAGVTGAETKAKTPAENLIETLDKYQAAPPVIGFGISEPAQVKAALEAGAKGAISGSAVVKIIEKNLGNEAVMLEKLHEFVSNMKAATR